MGEAIDKIKMPTTCVVGVGTGVALGDFVAEFVARVTGQTGWKKVGLKGLVKGAIGFVAYMISTKLPGLWSLFAEMVCYGSVGSISIDVMMQLYEGGIWGLAERMAIRARGLAKGAEKASEHMGEIEKTGQASMPVVARRGL